MKIWLTKDWHGKCQAFISEYEPDRLCDGTYSGSNEIDTESIESFPRWRFADIHCGEPVQFDLQFNEI